MIWPVASVTSLGLRTETLDTEEWTVPCSSPDDQSLQVLLPSSLEPFISPQLPPLISLPPLPSSTLGTFKLLGSSFGCQWQRPQGTVSVAEVLERRQVTTWIPAIAKEPGDPGDYSITRCQVSQHHSSANLPSHQGQAPGWYMGLSGWNWWAVRNHQVHSAAAGWAKASLGSCSFGPQADV